MGWPSILRMNSTKGRLYLLYQTIFLLTLWVDSPLVSPVEKFAGIAAMRTTYADEYSCVLRTPAVHKCHVDHPHSQALYGVTGPCPFDVI